LARKYNIRISTVCDIKKNEEILKAFKLSFNSSGSLKKKENYKDENWIKQVRYHNFRFFCYPVSVYYIWLVYLWFVQKRTTGMPVSGPIVIEKASQFHANGTVLQPS